MSSINWQQILGWQPEQVKEVRFAGFSFFREGHYHKALMFFEALVILDPASTYDFQTLGAIYLEMGDNEKALHTLNTALALQPDHDLTKLNRVKALLSLEKISEALVEAKSLEKSADPLIANDAAALILAYR